MPSREKVLTMLTVPIDDESSVHDEEATILMGKKPPSDLLFKEAYLGLVSSSTDNKSKKHKDLSAISPEKQEQKACAVDAAETKSSPGFSINQMNSTPKSRGRTIKRAVLEKTQPGTQLTLGSFFFKEKSPATTTPKPVVAAAETTPPPPKQKNRSRTQSSISISNIGRASEKKNDLPNVGESHPATSIQRASPPQNKEFANTGKTSSKKVIAPSLDGAEKRRKSATSSRRNFNENKKSSIPSKEQIMAIVLGPIFNASSSNSTTSATTNGATIDELAGACCTEKQEVLTSPTQLKVSTDGRHIILPSVISPPPPSSLISKKVSHGSRPGTATEKYKPSSPKMTDDETLSSNELNAKQKSEKGLSPATLRHSELFLIAKKDEKKHLEVLQTKLNGAAIDSSETEERKSPSTNENSILTEKESDGQIAVPAVGPPKKAPNSNSKEITSVSTRVSKAQGLSTNSENINSAESKGHQGQSSENHNAIALDIASSGITTPEKHGLSLQQPHKGAVFENSTSPSRIPEEWKRIIAKYDALRSRYRRRAEELIQRGNDGLEEEKFQLPSPNNETETNKGNQIVPRCDNADFPESLVPNLAVLIQGSRLPLSALAQSTLEELRKLPIGAHLSLDAVSAKIKLFASRESYTVPPSGALLQSGTASNVDIFENTDPMLVWRWELIALEMLPAEYVPIVKKARKSRRKLRSHSKAIAKFLSSLDEADRLFHDISSKKEERDAIVVKINNEEEKVLKFEREEEKLRLQKEAKIQKEQTKTQRQLKKQKEKEKAEEEKRKEKEEKELKKKEAAKAREELKRRKEEEREKEKEEQRSQKEEEIKKQRATMMSFLAAGRPSLSVGSLSSSEMGGKGTAVLSNGCRTGAIGRSACPNEVDTSLDSDAFWSVIGLSHSGGNQMPPFHRLSRRARKSRKRRTRIVSVAVYTTADPTNSFGPQPYAEQRVIRIPNKYKFLSFHEDYRPPYHGTWSKPRSSIVTGKNPFGKDNQFLDYEVDSEAEWEEGDEEPGEDCEVDDDDEEDKLEDEEGDTRVYNYQDGWLAQDDDLGLEDDEDNDEETKELRKKIQAASNGTLNITSRIGEQSTFCIVAPLMGGLPPSSKLREVETRLPELIEGTDLSGALDLVSCHTGIVLSPTDDFCLDPFPPPLIEESNRAGSSADCNALSDVLDPGINNVLKEMSPDDLKTFAVFVHGCQLASKDKVVEELRMAHKNVTSSRAQAVRKLNSIAVKKRLPNKGGVVWEVKKDVLESVGLKGLLKTPIAKEDLSPSKITEDTKRGEKSQSGSKQSTPGSESCGEKTNDTLASRKRKQVVPEVSQASASLFAAFLSKKSKRT